ncbi:MAG: hypothetical protein U1E05_18155 [Patescibacteria group bacterium]|nr:hypothetical protein [Patescibacteria group bacterium]
MSVIAVAAVLHVTLEGLTQFVQEIARTVGDPTIAASFLPTRATVPIIAAMGLAVYRILGRHPALHWEYQQWLRQSPWTPAKPLPMGGIQPRWSDPVVVALLCWLASGSSWSVTLAPALSYAGAFVLATCQIAGMVRQRAVLFVLLFGAGLAIRLAESTAGPLLVLAALIPLAIHGLRQSLEPRCWPSLPNRGRGNIPKTFGLGWPHELLGPKPAPRQLETMDGVGIALLIGWYASCLFSLAAPISPSDQHGFVGWFIVVVIVACAGRSLAYAIRNSPPISLIGRFVTGQWIIPGYDQIFLAPVVALAVFAAGEWAVLFFRVPFEYGQPVLLTACALPLLAMGPSLRRWDLTGSHRITPTSRINAATGYLKV